MESVEIEQQPFAVRVMDGTVVRGWRYCVTKSGSGRKRSDQRSPTPLVCIPSGLGTSREFHNFILHLQTLQDAPKQVVTLDLRGRGRSDRSSEDTYSPIIECDDVISVCDALGLHEVDFLANGRGGIVALLTSPKRPSLIKRLILNDAGPENDAVGIVRMNGIHRNMTTPRSWPQAVESLKTLWGNQFSGIDEDMWEQWAQSFWKDEYGEPVIDYDPKLQSIVNDVDFDAKQPTLWGEIAIQKNKDVLLVKGEHSPLLTDEIAQKMKAVAQRLQTVTAQGQGHIPLLGSQGLPEKIVEFLATSESSTPANADD